jgi:hypothetical protein
MEKLFNKCRGTNADQDIHNSVREIIRNGVPLNHPDSVEWSPFPDYSIAEFLWKFNNAKVTRAECESFLAAVRWRKKSERSWEALMRRLILMGMVPLFSESVPKHGEIEMLGEICKINFSH